MYLEILTDEEKQRFLDLAYYIINIDQTRTKDSEDVIKTYKNELGEFKPSKKLPPAKAIAVLKKSNKISQRIIVLNLIKLSLTDDFYHQEEHLFIEDLLAEWDISQKKKSELVKLVYLEKDVREKAKMVLSE